MSKDSLEERVIFNKYLIVRKIGEGAFGQIYLVQHLSNPNEKFAIKIESKNKGPNLLENEAYILNYLKGVGIPFVKSFGFSLSNNVLVMELLGVSLATILKHFKRLTLKTVCLLAVQMLHRIEFIHNKHIIHRDIKPENFTIGEKDPSTIYLIDFGLAKQYRSSKTHKHVELKNHKRLTGTARYASINALKGLEQSRRDDIEALGYVLIYLYKGSLPWQGLRIHEGEDRYKRIYQYKSRITSEELCFGMPIEFSLYMDYARSLQFEEQPDYNYLRNLFYSVITKQGFEFDNMFDWIKAETISYSVESSTKFEGSNTKHNLFYEHQFNTIKNNLAFNEVDHNYLLNSNILKNSCNLFDSKNTVPHNSIMNNWNDNSSIKGSKNCYANKLYDMNYKFIESVNKNCENMRRNKENSKKFNSIDCSHKPANYNLTTLTTIKSINKKKDSLEKKERNECIIV